MRGSELGDYLVVEPPEDPGRPLCFCTGSSADPGTGGWSIHLHRGLELGIVLRGQLEIRIDRKVMLRRRGDVWLHGMWEAHAWRQVGRGSELVVMTFLPQTVEDTVYPDPSWLRMFSVQPEDRPNPTRPAVRQRILATGYELRSEALEQRPLRHKQYLLGLLQLLVELSRDWRTDAIQPTEAHSLPSPFERLLPALTLANSVIGRRVTAQEGARACNLSVSRFEHVFREIMGVSFAQFAARARVGSVAHSLLTTDLPLSSIAEQEGFVDASHLHRVFRRYCGCTPGEFRKRRHLSQDYALMLAADGLLIYPDGVDHREASPDAP